MASPAIQIFSRDDILAHLPQLADILHSCVTRRRVGELYVALQP